MSEVAKIASEVQLLNPTALITLYELDTTMIAGGTVFHFHPDVNGVGEPIVWNSQEYVPFPILAEGFEWRSSGTMPRPTVHVANVAGLFGELLREMDDLVGAKLTRIRTFARYLDAVNFPDGNPLADPTAEMTRDVYYINRTVKEGVLVEFELAALLEVHGIKLPRRLIAPNACPWKYRGPGCEYAGPPVADVNDNPTTDPALDRCGCRLSSCKLRFPNQVIPFGGFPGAALVR